MAASQNDKNQRRRVLLVTDTPEDLHTLQDQLGDAGYHLAQTWGAEEALQKVRQDPPDLILLDIGISQADDVEFCKQLHSRPETEAIPVIAIANQMGGAEEELVLDIGADGIICRPFQAVELLSRVQTLLRMKDLHDRVAEQNRELLDVNARLDQRNRELELGVAMAHRLQEALLPQHYPPVKNVAFAHKYTPADAIGGDFFQITGMPDGRAAIFIADVSGHGIRAALITSIVKTVINYIDPTDKTPGDVLTDFNSRFRGVLGPMTPQIYATGVLMVVDGERRSVSVACAGHPAPLHINKQQMTAEPLLELDDYGPALGFLSDPDYPTVERELAAGDIVLALTDGVFEVLNEHEEMFGFRRLQQLVADNARLVPRDLIPKIITETEEFMGARKRPDDVCLLTIEML